jgi:hypothetical protein
MCNDISYAMLPEAVAAARETMFENNFAAIVSRIPSI